MRNWAKKREWKAEKQGEGVWRDVYAYDASDIEAWLETHPEIHEWTSIQIGLTPTVPHSSEPVPFQLAADTDNFVGRESEIETISRVRPGGVAIISGPPGVGKTSLARQVARSYRNLTPAGTILVNLQGTTSPVTPEQAITTILSSLGLAGGNSTEFDLESAITKYRSLMADRRVTLVLDNAANEPQVRPLITSAKGSITIITSRSRLSGLDRNTSIHLDPLSDSESIELLRKEMPNRCDTTATETAALRKIAFHCGRLPLALKIIGRKADQTSKWPLNHIANQLSSESTRLDQLSIGDVAVRATFSLSYRRSPKRVQSAFRSLSLIPGSTFDEFLASAALNTSPAKAASTIAELLELGLVEPSRTPGRYQYHDLLRLFGQEKSQDNKWMHESEQSSKRVARYLHRSLVDAMLTFDPKSREPMDEQLIRAAMNGDLLRWLDGAFENIDGLLRASSLRRDHNAALAIAIPLGIYLETRANWKSLRDVATRGAIEINRVRSKGTGAEPVITEVETSILLQIAKAEHGLRDFDAASKLIKQAETLCVEKRSLQFAEILNMKGNVERSLHSYKEAITSFKQSGALAKDLGAISLERMADHNIGATLSELGRNEEAIPYLERDLVSCRDRGDLLGVAHTLNTLGNTYCACGDYDEAIKVITESIDIYRRLDDRVHESFALNDLGLVLRHTGNLDEAYRCHFADWEFCVESADNYGAGKALIRMSEILGELGPGYHEIAQAYLRLGRASINPEAEPDAIGSLHLTTSALSQSIGDNEIARRSLEIAYKYYLDIGNVAWLHATATKQAKHMLDLKLPAEAKRYLEQFIEDASRLGETQSHNVTEAKELLGMIIEKAPR
ncbi:tetratricopeptide repeat protein [Tsukamurella sp. TY48]|uniref:tetratricopeptide repeat protein n=1 Tax=Tsukamurella TaxID=2060 RepID=UPI001C7D7A6C|nr:tetratricopeptide repeat protein [Tsukamurella sp. TY48]